MSRLATLLSAEPAQLDVILVTTPSGAPLADLCAGRAGCVGLDPVAHLDVAGRLPPTVTVTAGSEPSLLGASFTNPLGAIWAAALTLECLGHPEAYLSVMAAVDHALTTDSSRPFALGGRGTAADFTHAVCTALASSAH